VSANSIVATLNVYELGQALQFREWIRRETPIILYTFSSWQ
jgi:hypothetical protein